MTSSTWISEPGAPIRGAGIDAERVARFGAGVPPLTLVFSAREAGRLASLPDPAEGFCTSFCCKEALFKAAGMPIDPHACEWVPGGDGAAGSLVVSPALAAEIGAARVEARTWRDGDACVAVVILYGEAP